MRLSHNFMKVISFLLWNAAFNNFNTLLQIPAESRRLSQLSSYSRTKDVSAFQSNLAQFKNSFLSMQDATEDDRKACTDQYDYILVLDASGTITKENWKNKVVPMAKAAINMFTLGVDKIHVSIIIYNDDVRMQTSLNDIYPSTSKSQLFTLLNNFKHTGGGGTRTAMAYHKALAGFMYARPKVKKRLIIVTHGEVAYKSNGIDATKESIMRLIEQTSANFKRLVTNYAVYVLYLRPKPDAKISIHGRQQFNRMAGCELDAVNCKGVVEGDIANPTGKIQGIIKEICKDDPPPPTSAPTASPTVPPVPTPTPTKKSALPIPLIAGVAGGIGALLLIGGVAVAMTARRAKRKQRLGQEVVNARHLGVENSKKVMIEKDVAAEAEETMFY